MTITIELPEDVGTQLQADAEAQGRDAAALAADRLAAFYGDVDPEAVEGIRRGLEAGAAGDEMPFEEYVADVMEKRRQRDAARESAAA